MEPTLPTKTSRSETLPIILIIALILLGGVFYGLDLYHKAKAKPPAVETETSLPNEGPVLPSA